MQIEECIKNRRSVRKYSDKEIDNAVLDELVDLARFSPSWANTQVVRYHVVKNSDLKAKIAMNCTDYEYNAKTIMRCKALVVVSVVTSMSGREDDGSYSTSKKDRWEMFDAGLASQTFCLAAYGKGIGSVILGVFDEEKIRPFISLPKNERAASLIAIGYPLSPAKSAPHRKEVSELLEIIE
jgi:nitroreductase